eukprot:CAMPEP_0201739418 /NCGR_PEP_ID=MMETSP0593-20130828/45770_1 /ASSEMBLY_ACC=CAM_ASM_000672 /TAXON_ID=267983 /ORGANISM="Skeletonema japonicum, Strain CCMP2506" /LENGTH=783 /DNA_ID=CAMNT_0048233689 /DNA_START=182 /DNA_END=2530 /DNA_ORIENTATION=+
MTKNLLSASTMLLICSYITTSDGNSNMVSITHRSSLNGMPNDYSSGLNVVKSTNKSNNYYNGYINQGNDDEDTYNNNGINEPEEYVTNFYRQKRIEKRELAAKAVGVEEANNIYNDSHSLDHYFDHDAIGVQSGQSGHYYSKGGDGGDLKKKRAFFRRRAISSKDVSHDLDVDGEGVKRGTKRPAFLSNSKQQQDHARASVASSVRGGSIARQQHGSTENHRGHGQGAQYHHQSRRNQHQQRRKSQQRPSSATFAPHRHRNRRGDSHLQYQRHDRARQEVVSEVEKRFNYSDQDTDDRDDYDEEEYDDHYDYHDPEESEVDKRFNYSDQDTDDRDDDDEEEYDDHYDYSSNHDPEDDDDYIDVVNSSSSSSSMSPHQAGLLRVPCSLRLNSNENTHYHHSHSTTTTNINNKSTPVAAYVDTGAQVTVISAAVARKVGILHLMDRRYAGRATGVGHCRILGRIPAGCVQFVLGQQQQQQERHDDDYYDCDDYYEDEDEGGTNMVQMNGPALTVLEGTVTEGVDMLLGLDVLQDWEATIQMGGSARQSSITVKKRGMSKPVVLPFLVGGDDSSKGGDGGKDRRRKKNSVSSSTATTTTAYHGRQNQQHHDRRRRQQQRQQHTATKTHHHDKARHEQVEDDDDDDLFSIILSSDIESDLDILDQSEFDGGKDRRRRRSVSSSTTATTASHGRQQHHDRRRRQQQRQPNTATKTHYHDEARHERNIQKEFEDKVEDDDDDDLFSIILSSDIESDLDILDQTEFTHEFPDEGRRRRQVKQCDEKIVHD